MKTILNSTTLRVYVALFALAGTFAYAAQPAVAAELAVKGCWYKVGDPPACDICAYSCGAGQGCCTINPT